MKAPTPEATVRIGVDIDGVMYQWDRTARYMLRNVLPNSPYKAILQFESQGWDWIKDQVAPKHWQWLWTEGIQEGLFRYGNLYPGTIEAIRDLATLGDVVLITQRPKQAVPDTLAWLSMLNLPISGLHFLTAGENKASVRPQCDVYLDDRPDNVIDLRAGTNATRVCLMARPWNRNVPLTNGITEVHSWNQFVALVELTVVIRRLSESVCDAS
jgi:uncharacterized HAD superfamily protein